MDPRVRPCRRAADFPHKLGRMQSDREGTVCLMQPLCPASYSLIFQELVLKLIPLRRLCLRQPTVHQSHRGEIGHQAAQTVLMPPPHLHHHNRSRSRRLNLTKRITNLTQLKPLCQVLHILRVYKPLKLKLPPLSCIPVHLFRPLTSSSRCIRRRINIQPEDLPCSHLQVDHHRLGRQLD